MSEGEGRKGEGNVVCGEGKGKMRKREKVGLRRKSEG